MVSVIFPIFDTMWVTLSLSFAMLRNTFSMVDSIYVATRYVRLFAAPRSLEFGLFYIVALQSHV